MRSFLILNTPWQGTGNRSTWTFSGRDEKTLRDCLDNLRGCEAPDPNDRWTAAIAFGSAEQGPILVKRDRSYDIEPGERERAWTIDGALALAELLPETLSDLRTDLVESFTARKAGWPGDAHTPPRSDA